MVLKAVNFFKKRRLGIEFGALQIFINIYLLFFFKLNNLFIYCNKF